MKRTTKSWILYDWANSVFALTVMAAFFPIMFKKVWAIDIGSSMATTYLAYGNSISGIIVAFLSPFLGANIAILGGRKKGLIFWSLLGVISTVFLSFISTGEWLIALSVFVLARIGFQLANFYYDSILIDVSTPKNRHKVSSLGFSFGYLGCGMLFLLNIFMVLYPSSFGLSGKVDAIRVSIFIAAIWWLLFSIPIYKSPIGRDKVDSRYSVKDSITRFFNSFKSTFSDRNIAIFLISYWFYIDGVHTIVIMATDFALSIGLPSSKLLIALLVVQVVAFPSALILGRLADKIGAKKVITSAIMGYVVISFTGAMFLETGNQFILFAGLTGVVQGGIQAISRSVFSLIIPKNRSVEMFGIYNTVGRFSVILGPILVGTVNLVLHNIGVGEDAVRYGFASLSLLFIIGGILFQRVSMPQGLK